MIKSEIIAIGVGGYALIGCIMALIARANVVSETGFIRRLSQIISNQTTWSEVYETDTKTWLKKAGISPDSHAGALLTAVKGGWAGGKLPTLGELQLGVMRREKGKFSLRSANAIAATLLIVGIAGTLVGVHPILIDFKIGIAADGTVQEAADSAQKLMEMVSGLGNAFLPSLAALGGTLIVLLFRSLYVFEAVKLLKESDLIVADQLVPAFRIPTQEEVFRSVNEQFSNLSDRMVRRDEQFSGAVNALLGVVEALSKMTPDLDRSIQALANTASNLSGSSESVVAALDKSFNEQSPVAKTLTLVEELSGKISTSYSEFTGELKIFTDLSKTSTEQMARASERLAKSTKEFSQDLKAELTEVKEGTVKASNETVNSLAESKAKFSEALEGGLTKLSTSAGELQKTVSNAAKEAADRVDSSAQRAEAKVLEVIDSAVGKLDSSTKEAQESLNGAAKQAETRTTEAISKACETMQVVVSDTVRSASNNIASAQKRHAEEMAQELKVGAMAAVSQSLERIQPVVNRLEALAEIESSADKVAEPSPEPPKGPGFFGSRT